LIDIMFFLLASFMMVSLSQVHMKGIKGEPAHRATRRNPVEKGLHQRLGRRQWQPYFDKEEMNYDTLSEAAIGVDRDADVILFRLGFAALPGGQVHLDALMCTWLS